MISRLFLPYSARGWLLVLFFASVMLTSCSGSRSAVDGEVVSPRAFAEAQIEAWLLDAKEAGQLRAGAQVDTLIIDTEARTVAVHFNRSFAHEPFREDNTAALYDRLAARLGTMFTDHDLTLYALSQPLENLIPNYYRTDIATYDAFRLAAQTYDGRPLVHRVDAPWQPTKGLQNRHIGLWHSHGWYYEPRLDRWEWQRARVFQTVEDLLPMAFTVPYLAPMLENAGANVLFPRERDIQTHEIVIDNDDARNGYAETGGWLEGQQKGFAVGTPPYTQGVNPFKQGTYRQIAASDTVEAQVTWEAAIPETGTYAVYVSYAMGADHVTDAHYTVHHAGGTTAFHVNQQMGGGTWIYLGTFRFLASEGGHVVLTNQSAESGRTVTADAVRFGGGMGNIARNGQTSGRPRFVEGARYYMQYAGMPDTLVYNVTEEDNDYVDDFRGRPEWVNYLRGAPFGPNKRHEEPGLQIPIDLSVAFHTDAGYTRNDTTIGTLMIYSSEGATGTVFPDSVSRFANRDVSDIVQTQIVEDLRTLYDPAWTRRSLWDREYSEAFRPNVPSFLLELLSHHNYRDMTFALDPRFRFDVSRAIYKGILRFLATQHGFDYVVQPLPPTHLATRFADTHAVTVTWQPQADSLEATATAEQYVVYTRRGTGGFDNGQRVEGTSYTLRELEPDLIYSFKVTAVNAGGESFPSEILSVGRTSAASDPVLIVNGFDRVSGPARLEAGDMLGFADFKDQGVPDRYDFHYVGAQYDFDANSPWLDDDAPGHGASHADYETTVLPGNTFDFPAVHGAAILASGHSFVSVSDEAVMDGQTGLGDYAYLDLILGEERTTDWPKPVRTRQFKTFPPALQQQIRSYLDAGGHLFVSGAYLGTDLFETEPRTAADSLFGTSVLKLQHRTNHASREGRVASVSSMLPVAPFAFVTGYHPTIYATEAPDAIEPADAQAQTILRYPNSMSAGIAYAGEDYRLIAFGFPFEGIASTEERARVMDAILAFLKQ